MAWVKVDDGFFRHDKARAVGKDGRALFLASLCYAADRRKDGAIPAGHVAIICAEAEVRPSTVRKLLEAGLWEVAPDGYLIHDYLDYQPSADEVEERRQKRAEAGRRGGTRAAATRAKRQASATANAQASATAKPKQPRSKSPTPSPVTQREPSTKVLSSAEAAPSAEAARDIVNAFWEACEPKPATKWIALVKLAEQFLDAGWSTADVHRGFTQTRAFTRDSIEFTLRQAQGSTRQQQPKNAHLRAALTEHFASGKDGAA